jgi:hypothetical protein
LPGARQAVETPPVVCPMRSGPQFLTHAIQNTLIKRCVALIASTLRVMPWRVPDARPASDLLPAP